MYYETARLHDKYKENVKRITELSKLVEIVKKLWNQDILTFFIIFLAIWTKNNYLFSHVCVEMSIFIQKGLKIRIAWKIIRLLAILITSAFFF